MEGATAELLPVLLPRETSPGSSAILDPMRVRDMIFGVLRRTNLQDQTFPWTSYNVGAFLAGEGEGVMCCLPAAGSWIAVQLWFGCLGTADKTDKKYHFCTFERQFPSALHLPSSPCAPERKAMLAFEALPMVQAGRREAEPWAGTVGKQSCSVSPCPNRVSSQPAFEQC